MILKRILLIIWAAVRFLILMVGVYCLAKTVRLTPEPNIGFYAEVINYVNSISESIRAICLLAVVDFVFCIGRKSYGKSTFALAITMFVLAIVLSFEGVMLVVFHIPSFFQVIVVDQYTTMAYFYLLTVLKTLPFVGLAVAYVVTKHNYLKKARNNDTL